MPELETPGTQEEQDLPEGQLTSDSSSGDDDYFLVVDDRTRYKTPEDAQKAYREAGTRISQLSAWEREIASTYEGADPRQVREWLEDYRRLRTEAEARAAEPKEKPATGKTTSDPEEELNPEEQKALAWIKKHAPRLGFVPKEELSAVQEQLKHQSEILEQLQGNFSQVSEARKEELVEQGRSQLQGLMKEVGLPATEEAQKRIERFIRDYVNSDEALVQRWLGGQHKQVLIEAFNEFKALTGMTSSKPNTNYAANKNSTVSRTPKPLPKPQSGRSGATQEGNEQRKKEGLTPSVHDRAYALAQSKWDGGNAEP